ncbi:nicotinamide N-methyltransferase-like [Pseudophryne corroboree]|uniref:nicotinamide N-methyltransferase-like n=1 Tax=Pseudophryne corroboree TaxID=495146 RepID=UPI003081ABD9
MDCTAKKLYHVHGFESRTFLETFYSDGPKNVFAEESLTFPMEKIHQYLNAANIKGEVALDVCIGPVVLFLNSACEFFKDIYLLKFKESCSMEVNRWLNTRTGAFNWSHTSAFVSELEGKYGQHEEKEIRMKTAIKQIVQCDIDKENITDPVVLPLADCLISCVVLDFISRNQDEFVTYLRKFVKLLKPEGHILLVGMLNATFVTIGQDVFHVFKYDEDFIRNVLVGEGFTIDQCDVLPRNAVSDLIDHKAGIFIAAHREKGSKPVC